MHSATLRRSLAARFSPLNPHRHYAHILPVRFNHTPSVEAQVLEKYKAKLEQRLKKEGLDSINELKQKYASKIEALRKDAGTIPRFNVPLSIGTSTLLQPPPPAPIPSSISKSKASNDDVPPGVKTLSSYIDINKLEAHTDAKEIEFIWRARFLADETSICAVIPKETYNRLESVGRKHPMFILPLPRPHQGSEIHLLQWTFPARSISTIIITTLADYKLHGEFAIPHTTLSHHLDLADTKGLVLAQGNLNPDRGVTVMEASWLVMALQKFYGAEEGSSRRRLLEDFSRGDGGFEIARVVEEMDLVG